MYAPTRAQVSDRVLPIVQAPFAFTDELVSAHLARCSRRLRLLALEQVHVILERNEAVGARREGGVEERDES